MSQEIATEVKEENKMGTMPVGKLIAYDGINACSSIVQYCG